MKTAYSYRPRTAPRIHPVQVLRKEAADTQNKKHPARAEIERCLGNHAITATVEEDMQTLGALKHLEGVVAFLVTLTKSGRVISQGRGSAVFSPQNRFISRTVACAFNSALSDAVIRATKVLDTFRDKPEGDAVEEAYRSDDSAPATDKQRDYLRQLVQINCDEDERERWESQLSEITKSEASKAIESFRR